MIAGAHTIIFAEDAERARAFVRDVLGLAGGRRVVLADRGRGLGRLARLRIPGAGEIGIYEPRHPSPLPEFAAAPEPDAQPPARA